MKNLTHPTHTLLTASLILLTGCSSLEQIRKSSALRAAEKQTRAEIQAAQAEHALFRSLPNWKKQTFRSPSLLAKSTPQNTSLKISIPEQRGCILVNNTIAMEFPVATGRRSFPTPTGQFSILDKQRTYSSNLYGKIYDAEGNIINDDADARLATIPEGGRFVGAPMPLWMRLTPSGVGLHVGYVPGRPASHGCIRLRRTDAEEIFSKTKIGTPVLITNQPLVPSTTPNPTPKPPRT